MKAPASLVIAAVVGISTLWSAPDSGRAADIQQPPAPGMTRQPPATPAPGSAPAKQQEPVRKTMADLVVELTTTTSKHDYQGVGTCDQINAEFTVTNTGQREAKNFFVTLETKNEFHGWNVFWKLAVPSLKGGESRTERAGITERWCPGNTQTGFRVTADSDKTVYESDENNNVKTALFPKFQHELMQKSIQQKR